MICPFICTITSCICMPALQAGPSWSRSTISAPRASLSFSGPIASSPTSRNDIPRYPCDPCPPPTAAKIPAEAVPTAAPHCAACNIFPPAAKVTPAASARTPTQPPFLIVIPSSCPALCERKPANPTNPADFTPHLLDIRRILQRLVRRRSNIRVSVLRRDRPQHLLHARI